jgi:hypothetical protein
MAREAVQWVVAPEVDGYLLMEGCKRCSRRVATFAHKKIDPVPIIKISVSSPSSIENPARVASCCVGWLVSIASGPAALRIGAPFVTPFDAATATTDS